MHILAKSHNNITLGVHTQHVVQGCQAFFNISGSDLIKLYRVDVDVDRFQKLLITASLLHDLGKANDHFQQMIRGGDFQALRHEAISYVAMRHPPIQHWLLQALSQEDFDIISWVVAGHHRKFPPSKPKDHPAGNLTIFYSNDEIVSILHQVQGLLDLPSPPPLSDVIYDVSNIPEVCFSCLMGDSCGSCLLPIMGEFSALKSQRGDEHLKRLVACLKSCLIMGDVLGSIQDKKPECLEEDILTSLSQSFSQEMCDRIIEKKRKASPVSWELNKLQTDISHSQSRVTLIESGCGAGKTVTAYRWGRKHAHNKKLYVCYPTMGTATTGYIDYIEDVHSFLIHSTAWLELKNLKAKAETFNDEADEDVLKAFRVLGYPVISCTADTVLGLLQNYHLSLLGCAGFAHGAFVFDEIHSYDAMMWKALLRFIQFDVPCLLMTASLPEYRVNELKAALAKIDETLDQPDSRGEMEAIPRYALPAPMDNHPDEMWARIDKVVSKGGKVLWISNTVDSCIQLYDQAINRGMSALCYHSRFKTKDRLENHEKIIKAFRGELAFDIAFTTQVAEMSLDLSADVLITDAAPISAIIQRLGRLNRYLTSAWGQCYVLRQDSYPNGRLKHLPYEDYELEETTRWIRALPEKSIFSQDDLIETWRSIDIQPPLIELDSLKHIDGLMETEIGSLRKTDGINLEIVLEEDRGRIGAGEVDIHDVKLRVHVYKPQQFATWEPFERYTYIPPVETFSYTPERGAKWNRSPGT